MRRTDTYKEKRKGGFTLVEMIVVLVILSLLVGIAVPSYLGYVDKNKVKQCETHRKALASRLEEMSAMGVEAKLTDDDMNSEENGCPAGGTYTLEGSNTIRCDKHGDTTVILKNSTSIVTADVSNVQTEAPKEPEVTPPPADNSIPVVTPEPTPEPTATPTPEPTPPPTPTPTPMETEPEQTEPAEPKFAISVDPAFQKINLNTPKAQTLTAKVVTAEECNDIPDYFEWSVSPNGVVSIDGNGQSVNIVAKEKGSCTVTCTATTKREDGTGTVSATATASIVAQDVGVLLPEEILIPVWQTKNDSDPNATVNTHIFEELLNYDYNVPKGGLWECDDPRVTVENDKGYVKYNESTGLYEGDNGYITIEDNDKAGRYRLTYTYKGTTTGMWAQVVYPIQGMHSSDSQVFSMELEDERQLTVSCEWPNTTDGPMEWSCKDNEIIEFSPVDGAEKNNKVTVRAASVGTTTLTASMLCHYNQATKKTPLYQTFTYTITVNYKTLKGATAEKLVLVEGGEPQQIQFTPIPSEGTDPNITYKYVSSNTDDSFLSVTENGLVTPKKAGTATVRFDAYLNEKVVYGGIFCEIEIKADTSKVEVQGKKFNAASWEDLQEYLAGGRTDENFNRGGVYVRTYYEQWGAEQKELLVINPNASFEWKEEYENMTFEEFLNEPGIREQLFVPMNSNCIDLLANNAWYWAGPGSIAKRGEDLYVCIKQIDKGNVSEWPHGYLEEYFVKIA